jgi:hypothetical protein
MGMLCLGTARVASALAYEALPSGGDDLDTAVTIEAGSYVTDHEIEQNSFEYFKISVDAGQGLEVKVTTPTGEYPYAGAVVYDFEKEEVGSEVIIGDSNASKTITWIRGYEGSSTFYIAVGNEYDINATGTKYAISVDDYYDGDTETDVGGTFANAYELDSLGTYEGYITTEYGGTDLADLYKLRVAAGVKLTATVTPPSDVWLGVSIYNSDREEIADGWSSNDGAIATAEMSEALLSADDLYIKVHADYETSDEPISYTLKISSTEGTTDGDTTDGDGAGTDGDGDGSGGDTTDGNGTGPNWTLIVVGAGLLALTGVVAFAFLMKKKGSAGSTPKSGQAGGTSQPTEMTPPSDSAGKPAQPEQPTES